MSGATIGNPPRRDPVRPTDAAHALIVRAEDRLDERFLRRARRAGRTWQSILVGMPDTELAGLDVALEIELERRGLLDRAAHQLRTGLAGPRHGRHCPCSACAREDWTNPGLAACDYHPGVRCAYDGRDAAVDAAPKGPEPADRA